jgi:uncharacterized repeat protein (TIGR01451 family)
MNIRRLLWLSSAVLSGCLLLAAVGSALRHTARAAAAAAPGDVVINEVAWAGHAGLAGDEWIELYNTTAHPITLNGWRLYSADGEPNITLSGTVSAQGYYLIERTDDDTVSDVPADWMGSFGNGLANAGEVLTLTDELNGVIDTANGNGGPWPGGSASPGYYSMERIDPLAPDTDANWAGNDGLTRNGLDAAGNPINGTPKTRNSAASPAADLVIEKSGPTEVTAGARISFTLRLRNVGNITATDLRLTDTLPLAMDFITQTSSLTFSQPASHTLVWQLDELPISTEFNASVVLTADVRIDAGGPVHNRVAAAAGVTETAFANNVSTATAFIHWLEPNLSVAKTGPLTATPAQLITYTLRLSNTGDITAAAVRLTDSLPVGVTFITQTSSLSFSREANQLFWTAGDVPAGAPPLLITVTAQLSATAQGALVNVITATTASTETLTENNTAEWITEVAIPHPPAPDLSLNKSGPATATPGERITYTLRLSNTGQATAAGVRLTDTLPAGVVFLAQTGPFSFTHNGQQLLWTVGDLPAATPAVRISVTGEISPTAVGIIQNVVTATTATSETVTANNRAVWETQLVGGAPEAHVLINALLYDGYLNYQNKEQDEALQLVNVGAAPADLSGWKICDAVENGSCATLVSGTLAAGESVWLAQSATAFFTSFGALPGFASVELQPGVLALAGAWPGYANDGDEAVLFDAQGTIADMLVYENGDTTAWHWSGAALQPWSNAGLYAAEGQILYRRLDEYTGLPVADTHTAADWASYADDPVFGRRVRYPGWDLEAFYHPLNVTQAVSLTVGVAPDQAAQVVLTAIASAHNQIEISVYTLRHPSVISSLLQKANTGVSVTLLLEGDPAALSKTSPDWYQEMWACQELEQTGNGACWFMVNDADGGAFDRYTYLHAKYLLIDRSQVVISTQNLTDSGMPDDDPSNGTCGSRGVVLWTDAPAVVARVAEIFDHDLDPAHHADLWAWALDGGEYGPPPLDFTPTLSVTDHTTYTVVFSQPLTVSDTLAFELFTAPEAALRQSDALFGLLARAGSGDEVYVEQLDERAAWGSDPDADPGLRMQAYLAAARRGARVRILLNGGAFGADYYDATTNRAAADYANAVARAEKLDLVAALGDPTQYGIHNKMALVWLDDAGGYVHVGSLNGSETSSKANRELVIQVQSDAVYDYLKAVFDWDWYTSRPLYLPLVLSNWSAPEPPVGYPVISEVLYNPVGDADPDEWVEIYNPTGQPVDLSGWGLGDVGPAGEYGSGLYTFPAGAALPPGGVIVVARQAADVIGLTPDFEFVIDPLRNDPAVPDMNPAGAWDGFGFALGNAGDEVILLDNSAAPVDALVYGSGSYPGVIAHPGVSAAGHSLERRPAIYDSDDCANDFVERYPPDPGAIQALLSRLTIPPRSATMRPQ